jgi:hypothetical protein
MTIFNAEPDRTDHALRIRSSGRVGCDSVSLPLEPSRLDGSDRLHEPCAIGIGELHPSNLMTGINDQAVWNPFPELFFNEGTVGQALDHVIRIDLASSRRPLRFFQFNRHNPICGSDQTVWFTRDPQLWGPKIPRYEWLADEILIEHFSSGYSRPPTGPGAQPEEHESQDHRCSSHQKHCHLAHPSQRKTMRITASIRAAKPAHR